MKQLTLTRFEDNGIQTRGVLVIEGTTKVYATLELAWKNNAKRISCIPEGTYKVNPRWSKKFKNHLHLIDVPIRSLILIHAGNYVEQTAGCILIGTDFNDINRDGEMDIINSKLALTELLTITKNHEIKITITNRHENQLGTNPIRRG